MPASRKRLAYKELDDYEIKKRYKKNEEVENEENSSSEEDEEYVDEEDDKDEYFGLDSTILKNSLLESLSKSIKNPNLKSIVSEAVEESSKILEEYSTIKPLDNNWKIGVRKNTIRRLAPTLKSIRDELESERPTMVKILSSHLPKEDKKKTIELFDILNNTEPYTETYLDIKNRINDILKTSLSSNKHLLETEKIINELSKSYIATEDLRERIFKLNAPLEIRSRIYEKYKTMMHLGKDDKDFTTIYSWIDHALSLPYNNVIENNIKKDPKSINELCCRVKEKLDKNVYGLEGVKQEILNVLVNRISNPSFSSSILTLTGSPGVGKSMILSSVADALDIPFERISIGGLTDPAVIKGHSHTYMGATPGLIVQILKRIKYSNGLVFIDEIDKLCETERGREIQYCLLHITDLTTNKDFRDTYLSDIPIDLSKIMFVFAMNNEDHLDRALKDRLYIIKVPDYKPEEKKEILKRHLIPLALRDVGIKEEDVKFDDASIDKLIKSFPSSSNIRPLKDEIRLIIGRINLQRSVTLEDSSTGVIQLQYKLPSIKFPLLIDENNISLIMTKRHKEEKAFLSMYM